MRAELRAPGAQAACQRQAERATPLHEERLIERLMRHAHRQIVGKITAQPRRDLLRRPAACEAPLDLDARAWTRKQFRRLRTMRASLRGRIGPPCTILCADPAGGNIARDRRRSAPQPPRDHVTGIARHESARDYLTLG